MFIPLTMRIGLYRLRNRVDLGDGGNSELERMIRCQGNFVETVPLAVVMLVVMELMGAGDAWLHALGALLVFARVLHYLGLSRMGPFIARPVGMVGTFTVYLVAGLWILVDLFL